MRGLAAALAALALAAACATDAPRVALDGRWPARGGDYGDVTSRWTRHGRFHASFAHQASQLLDVYATFLAPEWRIAHLAHVAGDGAVDQALLAEAQQQDGAAYEVELLVATYDRRANDLARGTRSIWRVALVGDDGHEVVASEIVRDRRPRSEIAADFPDLGDFHEAYVARFPRTAPLLGAGTRQLRLRITSAQARVELAWLAP